MAGTPPHARTSHPFHIGICFSLFFLPNSPAEEHTGCWYIQGKGGGHKDLGLPVLAAVELWLKVRDLRGVWVGNNTELPCKKKPC